MRTFMVIEVYIVSDLFLKVVFRIEIYAVRWDTLFCGRENLCA